MGRPLRFRAISDELAAVKRPKTTAGKRRSRGSRDRATELKKAEAALKKATAIVPPKAKKR
jgi:Tfp pilus assembly protein PilX